MTIASPARALRAGALASFVLVLLGALTWPGPVVAGPVEDRGEAVVVDGAGSTRRLASGGSATEFSIRLPAGASCPGDSANDGYRVQSFMAPTTMTPATIQFDGLGPSPNAYGDWETFRQPLYDTATRPFASALTAVAAAPGQPGHIVDIPTFSFAVYGPGELPQGPYLVGIACTLANQPVQYWDTQVIVARAPEDRPGQVTWRLAAVEEVVANPTSPAGPAVLAGAVIAVVAAAAYARRRTRPRSSHVPTEDR